MRHIVSVDCETDGRIPGKNSMRQLGAVVFNLQGRALSRFSINLKQLPGAVEDEGTMKWWATQPREAWERVLRNPQDPKQAICRFFDWIANFNRPEILMSPVMYDGFFLRWYMETFIGESGFWLYHHALDLRSVMLPIFASLGGHDYKEVIQKKAGIRVVNRNPHFAVSDAEYQGRLYFIMMHYYRKNIYAHVLRSNEGK